LVFPSGVVQPAGVMSMVNTSAAGAPQASSFASDCMVEPFRPLLLVLQTPTRPGVKKLRITG
jgi:hypothetical protein